MGYSKNEDKENKKGVTVYTPFYPKFISNFLFFTLLHLCISSEEKGFQQNVFNSRLKLNN
jgi:hypothetical protein